MKDGYLINTDGKPTDEQLESINKLCRRDFKKEELFVFSVVLCDNEIDRDYERFSIEALDEMAKLFVGKTGICDHSCSTHDQFARIFECYVEEIPTQITKSGESYHRLVAKAYMPDCENNRDLITQIDAGIKKEVSVGCSFDGAFCSVCGNNTKLEPCLHKKGKSYFKEGKKQPCYHLFEHPVDAYEWSFVAVPAQPKAGVIKKHFKSEKSEKMDITEIKKSLCFQKEITLSREEADSLLCTIEQLEKSAGYGEAYFERLKTDVVKLFNLNDPEQGTEFYSSVVEKLNVCELEALQKSLKKRIDVTTPVAPQLANEEASKDNDCLTNYII